ncbi:MAG: hypothetical protein ABIQ73_01385 [Acidimicrobiales bacterium]
MGAPSGTVTFLFTDTAGSTRQWEERPDVMRAALVRHDEMLRSAIEARQGYVFSTCGDGFAHRRRDLGNLVHFQSDPLTLGR